MILLLFYPYNEFCDLINPNPLVVIRKKSISPPHLWEVDYITPQPMKQSISSLYRPLNFSKPVKLPLKAVSKNHSKSQKNHKMKNPIVLDSKWVDLHIEYIIWYALVHFFTAMKKSIDLELSQKKYTKAKKIY